MWHKYLTKAKRPILSFDLFMKDFESLSGHEAQEFRRELIDSLMSKKLDANDKKFLKRIGVEVRQGVIYKSQFLWVPYPAKTKNLRDVYNQCRRIEQDYFGSKTKTRYLFAGIFQSQKNLIKFSSKEQEKAILAEFRVLIEEYKVFPLQTLAYKWVKCTNTTSTQETIYDYLRRM